MNGKSRKESPVIQGTAKWRTKLHGNKLDFHIKAFASIIIQFTIQFFKVEMFFVKVVLHSVT